MNTPIVDFAAAYRERDVSRFHMPGHKGWGSLGVEALDLTEVEGADDLFHPEGILAESEANATALFGTRHTFYSTGGSSLCIKAMLHLALLCGNGSKTVVAGRNAHKAFLHSCALLGLTPHWLWPEETEGLCACTITPQQLRLELTAMEEKPLAVYITSPDYLGNMADIRGLSEAAGEIPLLVDNAHGAYLRFLEPSIHPMDLGATMCCDSAHKTLPVLTGGAYLHIAKGAEKPYETQARSSLALFGSSSPSYLMLQSLDACNAYLKEYMAAQLGDTGKRLDALRAALITRGISLLEGEPLKLTIKAYEMGLDGEEVSRQLRRYHIEPEYVDHDFVVLMASTHNRETDYKRVEAALSILSPKERRPLQRLPKGGGVVYSPREAMLRPREQVSLTEAVGRICADSAVSCPPAIPIVVSGECITQEAVDYMRKLNMEQISVLL